MSTRAIFLASAAALGVALTGLAILLVLASDHEDNKAATIALAVVTSRAGLADELYLRPRARRAR